MALSFDFDEAPYAWCNGNYYNIGDTIEEPEGTSVTIYADIKCLDPNDTEAKARLDVIWDGYIRGSSGWDWYYVSDIKTNRTCTVTIPSSQKDASFCVESELYSHDARCCITLKPKVTPSLTVTPLSHDSPAAGDSFTITVTSNIAWTVSDGLTWLVYTPASGSGDGTVSIYVDPNTATTSRTGYIHITGGGITRTCTITQAGAAAPLCQDYNTKAECEAAGCYWWNRFCHDNPPTCDVIDRQLECEGYGCYWYNNACHAEPQLSYLTVTPLSRNSPAAGESFTITVESNVSWAASTNKTWIHIPSYDTSGDGNGFVSFTVDENPGTDTRTGTITIAGDSITRTCTITQPGSKIIGDITKVTLDGKLLPESGTLNWIVNDDAHVKVFFKNISTTVAGPAHIWLTDETGATLTGCDVTTGDIPPDIDYYVDLCIYVPDVVVLKTLTAHIDP